MTVATKSSTELFLTRELDAPRDRVFAAWTDVEQASRWWAPTDFTTLACSMDVRPGGIWHRRMRAPDGKVVVKHGVYREIVPAQRLVFTYVTEYADGTIEPATLVTVTFTDLGGGRTRLGLRHTAFATEEACADHQGGWTGALQRFAAFMTDSP